MTILESELRDRLLGDDDDAMDLALDEHFEPGPGPTPFMLRWYPRADGSVETAPEHEGTPGAHAPSLRDRLIGWANGAQRGWRWRRYARQRARHPEWPVVVCEGDSWVAHPIITDITDHLLDDDRYPLCALGVGAAADLLGNMDAARDHEHMVEAQGAAALLLSGGGNDLMLGFARFLRPWTHGGDPTRLFTPAVDVHMAAIMDTMKRLLVRARQRVQGLPIVVHGYDYLRVAGHGEPRALARILDLAGVLSFDERRAVLRALVDRYNAHLRDVVACVEGIRYVDVRGRVLDDAEWSDEIHPNGEGFARIAAPIAEALLEHIADARAPARSWG